MTDLIIIGAGPSALSAAVYTTREELETVLYEKGVVGGLAAITDHIDNYPGFPDGVEGMKLASQFEQQANRFGAQIEYGEVSEIRDAGDHKIVVVDGEEKTARAVLVATGSAYNMLGVPGEEENYGKGVHYCATCDGAFYKEKNIAVVGGGNSGVQEAIFLTRFAKHIDLLVRSEIRASEVLQRELEKYVQEGKVTVHLQTSTKEIQATDGKVSGVLVDMDGTEKTMPVAGVFVFIGLKPNTQFIDGDTIALDEYGHIKTDETLMTTMPGVFSSGDVRSGATMQIASAVGEGAEAALYIRAYLEEQERAAEK